MIVGASKRALVGVVVVMLGAHFSACHPVVNEEVEVVSLHETSAMRDDGLNGKPTIDAISPDTHRVAKFPVEVLDQAAVEPMSFDEFHEHIPDEHQRFLEKSIGLLVEHCSVLELDEDDMRLPWNRSQLPVFPWHDDDSGASVRFGESFGGAGYEAFYEKESTGFDSGRTEKKGIFSDSVLELVYSGEIPIDQRARRRFRLDCPPTVFGEARGR